MNVEYLRYVDFHVLGPVRVTEDGRSLRLGGPKQQLVLALLLTGANRTVSSDELIDGLWAEAPPDTARHTLQTYVSGLRKELGASIETSGAGYVLRVPPAHLDVLQFEELTSQGKSRVDTDPTSARDALQGGLDLWYGRPYGDLADEMALRPEVTRLEELRVTVLEERIEADLALGNHAAVVPELETLTLDQPLRERPWGQLMLALYRSGRQADALRAYGRLRSRLVEELGIDPSPQLQQLEQRILEQDTSLDFQPTGASRIAAERPGFARPIRGYELREQIGEGDFGIVYRGYQASVGREVAVKVIRPEYANHPVFVRSFEAEAQLVAQLEHPHIVALYDFWRDPDGAYLALQYLRGGSLRKALQKGPWKPGPAIQLLEQIGSAISYAHRNGVVHRDIKPSNVLLDEDDNAYLSDFGISTRLKDEAGAPLTSSLPYLPPEEREGGLLTPQSDIFSLGVLVYELLTGDRPSSEEPLRAVQSAKLPAAVVEVIQRATAEEPDNRFERVEDLTRALRRALGADVVGVAAAISAVRTEAPLRNPYKGLRPFQETDAADFFGRDALTDELLGAIERHGLVGVVGPSGSGKSSAVRAGLIPVLRAGGLTGSGGWLVADMFPGSHPFEELEAALLRVAVDRPSGLINELRADELGLLRVCKQILPGDDSRFLLVIDQFEELFSIGVGESTRQLFLDSLRTLVKDERSRVRVVVTLRADFYDRPLQYPKFGDLLGTGLVSVTPPSEEGLALAVSRPARLVGLDLEPGLVGEIVADVRDQPGGLPLMQYALTELFQRRQDDVLTIEAYRAAGGVVGALGSRAEELYGALTPTAKVAAEQLFLRLVTVDEESDYTRRRVRQGELNALDVDQVALDQVIQQYGAYRLLSFDHDPVTRSPTVEVAHEALLREWPRLARWIDERREDLVLHRRLAAAVREWDDTDRDVGFLLSGGRLEQFETWAGATDLSLSEPESRFLKESRQAEDEREARVRRRRRILFSGVAAAALIALLLAVLALIQGREAQQQTEAAEAAARQSFARELAAAAEANLEVDPDLSLHLALRAVEETRAVDGLVLREAEEALHSAVVASRVVLRLPGLAGVAYSPDGRFIATSSASGVVIHDAVIGAEIRRLPVEGPATIALGPDSRSLAVAGIGSEATIWDAQTGERLASLTADIGSVGPVAFSPGGELLAGAISGGGIAVWDVETGEQVVTLPFATHPWGIAFSPDGELLAVPDGVGTVFYEMPSGEEVGSIAGDGRNVAFSPDGSLIATTGLDGFASVWDAESGQRINPLEGHDGHVNAVAFSPDGSTVATAGNGGRVRVWDWETGDQLLVIPGQQASVDYLVYSPDGTRLASGGSTGTLVWDITPSGSREVVSIAAHVGSLDVSYSHDGGSLGTAGIEGRATVWDPSTWARRFDLETHQGPVSDIEFSTAGDVIATSSFDGTAKLWDSSGRELRTLTGHQAGVWAVTFSPDGTGIATVSEDATARVWDVATGETVTLFEGHTDAVYDAAWSPSGNVVVTVSNDFTGRGWHPESGQELVVLRGHDENIVEQAFSPDGERVATAGFDGTARVWEVATGLELLVLRGHGGIVLDVEASPDGSRWATASLDGTIRIWDAVTGRELLTLVQPDAMGRLAFSPDGRRLAAVGPEHGVLRVYTLDVDELVVIAEGRVTRALTDAECRTYLHVEACPA